MRLCVIYNFAQHYRASIFKLISESFDCDFVFGDTMDDVKKMNYAMLNVSVTETHTISLFKGWKWQCGIISRLFVKYNQYVLLGDSRNLSIWLFCISQRMLFPKKKVYFWTHGWYGKESRLEALIKKVFLRLPNGGLFLYGNYARNLMIKEGFEPDKLFVIYNSLAYDKQVTLRKRISANNIYSDHFKNNNPNLFFIGRLTSEKRLDLALEALYKLRKRGKLYNLTIVGSGIERENLIHRILELGLKDCVWLYGACYDEELLCNIIYNADLCVSPGNVGLTAIHSMTFGTPVVTHSDYSHQGPEFEAIKAGVTGDFFKRDDVESMVSCIDEWFKKHADSRDKTREVCYDEIERCWNPHIQIDILKKVLNDNK